MSEGKSPSLCKKLSNIIIKLFPNKYGIIRKEGKARKHVKIAGGL